MRSVEQITQEAIALPPEDQAALLDRLYTHLLGKSVSGENTISQEWKAELRDRAQGIQTGQVLMLDWDVVQKDILLHLQKYSSNFSS